MRNWVKTIVGFLMISLCLGGSVSNAQENMERAKRLGSITIHSFDVEDFENLKGSTGAASDATSIPAGSNALEGVIFTIEKLDDSDGTPVSVKTKVDPTFSKREGKTDGSGTLVFDNLSEAYYLISQKSLDGHYAQATSFVVMLPMKEWETPTKEHLNYDIHVYPKNMQGGKISKQVAEEQNKVVGLGDEVIWEVNYEVDSGIKKEDQGTTVYAKDFFITDTMDSRLTYIEHSSVFKAFDFDGKPMNIDLKENLHYIESYDLKEHTVTWTYTDLGVKTLADHEVAEVQVRLTTVVNEEAFGTLEVMWNNASIDFVNAIGDPYHLDVFPMDVDKNGVNVPKVYLGSITIDKYEKGIPDKKLKDVSFKVAKTKEDAKSGKFVLDDKGKDYEVTTDEQGYALFTALGSGSYWLMETKTQQGYELLQEPLMVTIGDLPEEANVIASIENQLISTGGTDVPKGNDGVGSVPKPGKPIDKILSRVKTSDPIVWVGSACALFFALLILVIAGKKRKKGLDEQEK